MTEFPALLVSNDLLNHGSDLNGRRCAGKTLIQAWAAHLGDETLQLACSDQELVGTLEPLARDAGHSGAIKGYGLVNPAPYADIGGLFIPDPSIGRWARWRQSHDSGSFSLIGQIHTLNTPASIGHLEALASEPIEPWDALICTSKAGRDVVEALLNDREEQLQKRLSTRSQIPRPQLPVIPLPIPVEAMQSELTERDAARRQLKVPSNAHVCLWLGRLSMLTKLDPWPSYQHLQLLAADLPNPLWLIECGPDDTTEQGRHFAELRRLCPAVNFLRLGGPTPVDDKTKYLALSAADVALSLVDNCQETFGLSVVEAMAAGLPVVASDWDGYRDSVRDGIDGFLVPTRWAPGSGACSNSLGWQQQLGLLSFPVVSGALGQLVQVDMPAARACLATLLRNSKLAHAMGMQGRRRAQQRFATTVVMAEYASLFTELAEHRIRNQSDHRRSTRTPLSHDPVRLFGHFASRTETDPWPEQELHHLAEEVASNRSALWELLLQGLSSQERQRLLQELRRKHL